MDQENRYLSTAQVAQSLGLSVTTVKRWVDHGVLPARKTVGGHRKVLIADVLRLMRESDLPEADVSKLFPRPRGASHSDLEGMSRQLAAVLREGDETLVRATVLGAYQNGHAVEDVADRLVGPALDEIGHVLRAKHLSLWRERRAVQSIVCTLYELERAIRAEPEDGRPAAVGGAPEHDPTAVHTLLARLVLLDAGWDATDLGPHTPVAALHAGMDELNARLVWVCVSRPPEDDVFRRDMRNLCTEAERRGISVALLGRGLPGDVREHLSGATVGEGMSALGSLARSLYQRPGIPKKGRPPRADQERRFPSGT